MKEEKLVGWEFAHNRKPAYYSTSIQFLELSLTLLPLKGLGGFRLAPLAVGDTQTELNSSRSLGNRMCVLERVDLVSL